MDLAKFLRDVPDFPKPGIVFKDITPLLASPKAMVVAISRLAAFDFGRGDLDPLLAAPVVVGVFLGARVGTRALVRFPARRLQGAFAFLLLFIGVRMLWDAWRSLS